jgi:soluble lytic murein transglycosylase
VTDFGLRVRAASWIIVRDPQPKTRRRLNLRAPILKKPAGLFLPWVLALGLASPCSAYAGPREDFLVAEAALARGDRAGFDRLAERLGDYPLVPYLYFRALVADLDAASPEAVERFLASYPDSPLAERLRGSWLTRLAQAGDWETYLRLWVPRESPVARCRHLRALLEVGRVGEALAGVEPLWLSGESVPKDCDPVFDAWRAAGHLTPGLAWGRIELAVTAGQADLARYLARYLPDGDRVWVQRWLGARDDPERALAEGALPGGHPARAKVLVEAIARLSRRAPEDAAAAWGRLAAREALPEDQIARADGAVGLALAEAGDPRGLGYLDRVPVHEDNLPLQERRLRAALALGDWTRVAAWVAAMPEGETKQEHWLYWQARALEAMGEHETALALYREAARERSLWGFLAAERTGAPYRLESCPTPADPERVAWLAEEPAARRIAELRALGRDLDARREWLNLTRGLNSDDLAAAAVLAERWDWPDQAIVTLARSGWWHDLGLRFPLRYRETVAEQARTTGLPEAWIYAVLRQESAFDPQATSSAGARGLMQLMPQTARELLRDLGRQRLSESELHDPGLNIALGSHYLAQMERRFGGHPALAAAAYNAGPGAVARWLPASPMDADVWVATIPYRETRAYVRRVLAYRLIYQDRLGEPVTPLSELLGPIGGSAQQAQAGSGASEG